MGGPHPTPSYFLRVIPLTTSTRIGGSESLEFLKLSSRSGVVGSQLRACLLQFLKLSQSDWMDRPTSLHSPFKPRPSPVRKSAAPVRARRTYWSALGMAQNPIGSGARPIGNLYSTGLPRSITEHSLSYRSVKRPRTPSRRGESVCPAAIGRLALGNLVHLRISSERPIQYVLRRSEGSL